MSLFSPRDLTGPAMSSTVRVLVNRASMLGDWHEGLSWLARTAHCIVLKIQTSLNPKTVVIQIASKDIVGLQTRA
eukprot:11166203-Lingulodinium_polyedra.AAC.1